MFDHIINIIVNFFGHPTFVVLGGISTVFVACAIVPSVYFCIKGISRSWYRLGTALSKRKVAIFANSDNYSNLKSTLSDFGLFQSKNIIHIDKSSLRKAELESLLLVHWKSFGDQLEEILSMKQDSSTLIIYAPVEEGKIEHAAMKKISSHRNVIVVNFRGRLINDMLVCMMTSRMRP